MIAPPTAPLTAPLTAPCLARDEADVAAAVADAAGRGRRLEIIGSGSRRGLGRPIAADAVLDVSGLTGITLYEPEELVLAARCGTPVKDIEAMLAARGQMLAFEPMDTGPVLGLLAGGGTLGGLYAVNLSGPRRLSAGSARDHALGLRAVSGRGEVFKAGGRVVKNVTGYDLPRLNAGAFGTLAVATEITLKVLPRPQTQLTLRLAGLDADRAAAAMSAAMGSSCEVSGAAWLPASVAGRVPHAGASEAVMLRLEGVGPSVTARRDMLARVLAAFGTAEVLEEPASAALWPALRDALPFADGSQNALWRISTAPMAGPPLARHLAETLGAEAYCDWAGGLVWLALPNEASHVEIVRPHIATINGHATLLRAPERERERIAVFQPLDGPLAALTRRVKVSFDPAGVLNHGRMHLGL